MPSSKSVPQDVMQVFRQAWRPLVTADLAYKLLGFVLLAPSTALLLRLLIRLSGQQALSDQDILFFFLKPIGWATLIVAGAVIVGLVAMQLAALMVIGFGAAKGRQVGVFEALAVTLRKASGILRVTARMIGKILLVSAPFLALAGAAYLLLLTEYDINYYLTVQPTEYWWAIGIAVALVAGLIWVVLRLVSGWWYAVPLLLFEDLAPGAVLQESSRRTAGHRWWIARWIVAWAALTILLSVALTGPISLLGRLVIPRFADSLSLLVPVLGLVTVLLAVANLLVNVIGNALVSLLLVTLYRHRGDRGEARLPITESDSRVGARARIRLTRGRVIAGAVLALVLASVIGGWLVSRLRFEDDARVIAHRGASGAAPENTLAAVERAIADGADFVEIDVQETIDGVVVVAHDSDFMKVADDNTKIWESTLEHLQGLDIGSWFDPRFADETVPSLAEVLDLCRGRVKVNIELKYYGHDERLEERVVELVEERGMVDDVVIMSLKRAGVEKIQALRPEWTVGLLSAVVLGDLTRVDVDFLAVSSGLATPTLIRSAHRSGKDVYVWTVNDPLGMSTFLSRGVDGLITDEPALAREVVAQRAELSSAERLLVELAVLFGLSPEIEMSEADA